MKDDRNPDEKRRTGQTLLTVSQLVVAILQIIEIIKRLIEGK